jgi:hypothetical protein
MYERFDRGFLTHTANARPYWGGDVSITNLRPAPRRNAATGANLRDRIARLIAAIAGR